MRIFDPPSAIEPNLNKTLNTIHFLLSMKNPVLINLQIEKQIGLNFDYFTR